MATSKKEARRRLPKIFRILHARPKLLAATALGAAVGLLLHKLGGTTRVLVGWDPKVPIGWDADVLAGWDAGVALYLGIVYWIMARSEAGHIRGHAVKEDEGRVAILALTVTATLVSLAAIVALLGQGKGKSDPLLLIFAIGTILLSWGFVHTIFATHYAHEFYGESPQAGGLEFPGDPKPDYWDFVYFSFVIGMTFQVSDVAVTSRSIRHTVTAHAIVAFLFNVALLAIMINIAAGAI